MHIMVLAALHSTLSLLGWIIVGGLAGAFAGKVMRGQGFGILGDIVIGIVGALAGEFLLGFIISGTVSIIGSFIVAFLGACILLALLYALSGRRKRFFR
jgi:uncharacterized membrane protein YeaQ/YmgE (transglycosylase-associated protein family)